MFGLFLGIVGVKMIHTCPGRARLGCPALLYDPIFLNQSELIGFSKI
ncbi:hypothetical protein MARINOS108_10998 [Marinoscillum sp. 108]|nr:hypothetical protein MARINOS108_10998 [Marinoscillum sp. 108]